MSNTREEVNELRILEAEMEAEALSFPNLVNKYLEFNNVWTIEKMILEFKTIHANKVSYL